jgi:PAS domain S-box-containing protein
MPSTSTLAELVERQLEVASLSGEVQAVMQGIVDRLMELPGADGASISTIDDEFACFRVCAGEDNALLGKTLRLDDTLGNECLRTGEVAVLRATTGPEVSRCLTPGAGAIVLAPIDYDGATKGVLGVRSADEASFTEHEVEAIALLARAAAVALRNAEMVERLAASADQYRRLHAQAADAILVCDRDGAVLDANEAASALLWYSLDELRAMHARDLIAPSEVDQAYLRLDELHARRELRADRTFRRKDGMLLELEYSSRVLDDGRVHTTLRDVTQRKRNEARLRSSLERLHEIVQTQQEISELALDVDTIAATITQRAQRLAGAEGAVVQMFDGEHAVYRFASGIAERHVGHRMDRFRSLVGYAADAREVAYASDTEDDPRVDLETCRLVGARSLVCAPLTIGGEVSGALVLLHSEPAAFDQLTIETTRLMAEFVSTAFRNATELETRNRLVEELQLQGEIVQHMQMALWVWEREADGTFRLEYANEASEAATTIAPDSVVGLTLPEVLTAGDSIPELLDRVLDEGVACDFGDIEYGDDRIPPSVFTMRAFPLAGERVAVTFENVTEITRSRRALQESEARFRGAFDAASVGMTLTGLDGTFIQVNDRFAEMLGYRVDELMRLGVKGITHPEDIAEDLAYMAELLEGSRESFSREKRYLRKDGSVMWGDLTVSLVRGYDGAPAHAVAHVHDVTHRKEANLLYESMFERSVVPKLIADDEQRIVDLNDAAAELIGVTREEGLTLQIADLLPEGSVADLWDGFRHSGTMESEVTLHRPDGGRRQIEFVATANVRPGRHIAVVRDLSKQKELEAQLRQAQKMEAVGRLAGGIAHDFNNLLTAISGYSEFLYSGLEDDRLRRHAEEIKKASARAAALTGQLLAFSRRQVLQPRVLDLNAVVSDMDSLLRRLIGEDVELIVMLEPELANVQADPTQVEQVIVNLAVNARDAMPTGGAVTIQTANVVTDEGAFVELRLADTGVGMTEDQRQQLFDPFFTTKEGGTGLGLATVYGIVDQSGGTIEVQSSPGMGSTFRILLPSVAAEADEPAATPERAAPARGSETILLVEDETVVRKLVAEILETTGYTVLQAGDGPSALELLRRHTAPIELLVTDVVMPGMSGPEVAQAVTAMRPGTQVLYTSGYTDSQIGHHGVLEPGIAFLQKPFSADDLTRKVRALLDESAE